MSRLFNLKCQILRKSCHSFRLSQVTLMPSSSVQTPADTTPNKPSNRKKTLLGLILSLLSPNQIRKLRDRYTEGNITIAELSQMSECPPVLLYSILTPLWSKTAIKLRMLRLEKQVYLLRNKGYSTPQIALQLRVSESIVREHAEEQFSEGIYRYRPWYNDRSPKPRDPNELEYDEETLPPTSRLGWIDGMLTDIPAAIKGRCPICGHIVSLPCLACRVRQDIASRVIPKAEGIQETEEDEDREEVLLFR